jgi:hypothetical protein
MMTINEIQKIIDAYGGFDGAVIKEIQYLYKDKSHCIHLVLTAYPEGEEYASFKWKDLKITASDSPIFSWVETPQKSNFVINYPVKLLYVDERVIIDFDPLHQDDEGNFSRYFFGGKNLFIEDSE